MQALSVHPLVAQYRPARAGWLFEFALVIAGSAVLAASAQVAFLVPALTPVPVTGQTFAVLLIGALYGSRRGAATVLAYLGEGLAGLPVFAAGGAGAAHLIGPSGGYLAGFVLAAFAVGLLAERGWDRRVPTTLAAMTIGTIVLFASGIVWLSFFVGPERAIVAGLIPFVPGAIIKIGLAAALLPCGWKVLGRAR